MKKIPGRWIWLWLLPWTVWGMENLEYHLDISNPNPYRKEAVIVTLDARQTDTKEGVMRFEFTIGKKRDYEVVFLGEEDLREGGGLAHVRIRYALFALKEGAVEVPLHFVVKTASKEELKEVAIGARNVLRVVKTKDTPVPLKPLHLQVRPLPPGTMLVGDYRLEATTPPKEVAPYTQVDITYTLSGHGYPPDISSLLPQKSGLDLFLEKGRFDDRLFHKRTYHYAILATKQLKIPKVSLRAFNPKTHKSYMLEVPASEIALTKIPQEAVLDQAESLPHESSWKTVRLWIGYALIYLAGVLSGWMLWMLVRQKGAQNELPFVKKVQSAKDARTLLQVLLVDERYRFEEEIAQLEGMLYQHQRGSLKAIKESVVQKVLHA